jgi:tRNA A37 threonylcarbamoyladenosine synthetase subunit TsaC/SUA5/YrdC
MALARKPSRKQSGKQGTIRSEVAKMKDKINKLRFGLASMSKEEMQKAVGEFLDDLESGINSELPGSVSMIKHPLSEKVDWYFTYGDMKTVPIRCPRDFQDRDDARLVLMLEKA